MPGWVWRAMGWALIAALMPAAPLAAQNGSWELEAAWGPWSLSPLRSPIEREAESVIREEFARIIESAFLDRILSVAAVRADLESSGQAFSFAVWRDIPRSDLSLGLRAAWVHYRIPFRVSSRHDIRVLGARVGELETQGEGRVQIRSALVSLLARWNAVQNGRWGLSLYGGAAVLPFRGRLEAEGTAVLRTPLGDISVRGDESAGLDEIREWNPRVPAGIAAAVFGIAGRARISEKLRFFLDVSLAHGTAFAGGLAFVL